jgi:hypothetical protein
MKAKKIVALMLALVMVLALGTSALAATGDMSNPVTVSGVTLRFGDPNYPATAPEKYMYFKETGTGTYDAIYSTDGTTEDASYYPDILAFYVVPEEVNGEPVTTITSITGTDIDFVTYDASGNATISPTVAVNDDGFYTIKPKSDNSSITVNGNVTVSFSAPNVQIAEGSNPAAVTGYLPVGQFARYNSFGWGTLYTDNTNIKSTSNTTKFLDGYVSTGVSLGMAGGYIQFDMGTRPIMNDAKNRYGIDFIVYGNAFVGNPEAASVMVSNDGETWYTLAGSRHYMRDTKWNQKISYARIEGTTQRALNTAFTADGVYYSTNYVSPSEQTQTAINAAISAATWQGIPAASSAAAVNLSYWPEWATRVVNNATQGEYYGNVWKIGTDSKIPAVASTANNAGVNWDKADTTSAVPTGAEVITYSGLTIVPDDTEVLKKQNITSPSQAQMTDVYQWGYADVRVNGTAYGTAINPYASAASAESGGDGFDLSWAVDANGVPVKMSSARYIRVYSTVLFNAGIFGETSAEVCGLYRTSNTIADGAGMTAMPSVSVTDEATEVLDLTDVTVAERTDDNVICYNYGVDAGLTFTVTATDTDTLVFINGEARTSFTATSNAPIQVLVQKGTAEPFIVVIQ